MIWIGLSILVSSLIFVIFKLFAKFEVNNMQAIVVNYFVASGFGFLLAKEVDFVYILTANWIWAAALVGILFISLFNVMASVTQQNGVSVASVANKMSVVIPTGLAFFLYNDQVGTLKLIGIVLALAGIYLVTKKEAAEVNNKHWVLPLILFLGSGLLDSLLKYAQQELMVQEDIRLFTPTAFGIAGLIGVVYSMFSKTKWKLKNIGWGVALGIPNYFSILILLMALSIPYIESSVVFPINNVGVVLLSTLVSVAFFYEKLSKKNSIGIFLSILAILLISSEIWG